MAELREYQATLKEDVYTHFRAGKRAVMMQLPTGGGKSVIMSSVVVDAMRKKRKVLLIVHRKELVEQLAHHMMKHGIFPGIVMADQPYRPTADVQVASVQTIVKRTDKIGTKFDLIMTDECFPAGTIVDGRRIEDLVIGNYVRSFNHATGQVEQMRILRVFKSPMPHWVCSVYLSNGKEIQCTPSHPFYDKTTQSYVPAIHLDCNSRLIYAHESDPTTEAMHSMRQACNASDKESERHAQTGQSVLQSRVLQAVLQGDKFEDDDSNKSEVRFAANETEQSDVKGAIEEENAANAAIDWSQASDPRRQRSSNGSTTGDIGTGAETSDRVCDTDGIQWSRGGWGSQSLQSRHSEPGSEVDNRGRRGFPLFYRTQTSGHAQGYILDEARVVYVALYKSGSDLPATAMCGDGYVYNIEVEGNHNYFVEGVLVHNCHHSKADTYVKIYQWQQQAKHIGVTATPIRANGSGFEDLFEEMVCGPSVKELIQMGFLVQPRVFSSPLRMDLSLIRTTAGDYNEKDLYDVMSKRQITANVVETWKKHAAGKRTCVFAVNVEHSKQICSAYLEAGVRAAHVSATAPKDERERILRMFAKGDIEVITNCDIISEGFDVPAIECVQLVRPTKSLVKYLQCCGRALRPIEGKDRAIILDHGDCVFRMGFPDDDRQWTLQGIKPKPKTTEIMYQDASGRTYSPAELPEEVDDVELVEIDRSDYRRRLMTALIEQAKPTGQLNWAWREFIKSVQLPTREEIFEFQKQTLKLSKEEDSDCRAFAFGWTHIQMLQFGYRKKPPTKPIVEKEIAA